MVNNPPANVEDAVSIFWLGRFPGRGNGNPLQHSCLENTLVGYNPYSHREADTVEEQNNNEIKLGGSRDWGWGNLP